MMRFTWTTFALGPSRNLRESISSNKTIYLKKTKGEVWSFSPHLIWFPVSSWRHSNDDVAWVACQLLHCKCTKCSGTPAKGKGFSKDTTWQVLSLAGVGIQVCQMCCFLLGRYNSGVSSQVLQLWDGKCTNRRKKVLPRFADKRSLNYFNSI